MEEVNCYISKPVLVKEKKKWAVFMASVILPQIAGSVSCDMLVLLRCEFSNYTSYETPNPNMLS